MTTFRRERKWVFQTKKGMQCQIFWENNHGRRQLGFSNKKDVADAI